MYIIEEFVDDLLFEKAAGTACPDTDPADVVFFDIETTGLSPSRSGLYLIGCMYFDGKNTVLKQFFADGYEDENNILEEFSAILSRKNHMVHFNGSTFDIPYLKTKYEQHGKKDPFDGRKSCDIYRKLMPLKRILSLGSMKQKSLEELCGIRREDIYSGSELIDVYKKYQRIVMLSRMTDSTGNDVSLNEEKYFAEESGIINKDESDMIVEMRRILLLHNSDDIKGMMSVATLLGIVSLLDGKFDVGEPRLEDGNVKVTIDPDHEIPSCVFEGKSAFGFVRNDDSGNPYVVVPLINDSLRLFLSDFRNHYYIPSKDMAVHASVAGFIGKYEKKRATPATCYVPCIDKFLTVREEDLPEGLPLIKREYGDRTAYIREKDISPEVIKAAVMYRLLSSFPDAGKKFRTK